MENNKEEKIENELDKIVGYDSVKLEIKRWCDIIAYPEKYKKLGVKLPQGIFFYGMPGVGKTLMANCLMNGTNRYKVVCRRNKSNEDFVNYINECFQEARKNQPSIILLDDIDKFANDDRGNSNAQEYVTIQSNIDEIKGCDILVLATANERLFLPDSLLRDGRFDEEIHIYNPTEEDSKKIIKYYLSQKKYVDDLNIEEICKLLNGCSCATLENIINRAGIYSGFANKEKVDMDDIIKAIMRNQFNAPLSLISHSEDINKKIAYHEVGHAVVGELLERNSVSLISIINHSGEVGGITNFYDKDEYWQDFKHMENRIKTLLAGKALTELKFGKVDVGTESDIQRAAKIEKRIVSRYCSFGFGEYIDKLGENSESSKSFSSLRVACELDHYYTDCKELLAKNMDIVEKMVDELVKKQILTHIDIERIINDTLSKRKVK